jgi:hypothetical protein
MPVEVGMSGPYILVRLWGTLTKDDLKTLADRSLALEAAAPVPPSRMTDMTGVTSLQIAYPEINALAELRRAVPLAAPIHVAIVVGNDVQYGMARMFQTLNDHPQVTLEIFRERAAALAWLARADAKQA